MKLQNAILGIAVLFMFACEPEEPGAPSNGNQNQTSTELNTGTISQSAQNVLKISSKIQELESIGFGRPSILIGGFGFAGGRSIPTNGRTLEDDSLSNDEWDELPLELQELIEEIEAKEDQINELDEKLESTTDQAERDQIETDIEGLEEEIDELETKLEDDWDDFLFDEVDFEDDYYLEDCEYTSCAKEEFTENSDGSYTWVIDYGVDGCEEHDGYRLRGKMTETYTEDDNGFSGTIVYENFGDDEYMMSGTENFNGTHEDFEDSLDFSGSYTYSENLVVTIEDEIFTITASGTEKFDNQGFTEEYNARYEASDGDFAEVKTTKPLYFSDACESQDVFEYVSGVEEVKYQEDGESGEFITDYGNGTCDNILTITEDGETYQIDAEEEDWDEDDEIGDDDGDD